MPLQAGSSERVISANIAELIKAGHDPKQAAAIAYDKAGKGKSMKEAATRAQLTGRPYVEVREGNTISGDPAARAAAKDAGDRNMKKNGRTVWNQDDYNAATAEYNRLMPE